MSFRLLSAAFLLAPWACLSDLQLGVSAMAVPVQLHAVGQPNCPGGQGLSVGPVAPVASWWLKDRFSSALYAPCLLQPCFVSGETWAHSRAGPSAALHIF